MRLGGSRGSVRALGHWIARCGGRNPLVCNLRLGEGGQQVPLLPSICGPPPTPASSDVIIYFSSQPAGRAFGPVSVMGCLFTAEQVSGQN